MDWWCSSASLLPYILSHLEQVCTSIQSSELSSGIQALLCTCTCTREGPPDLVLWVPGPLLHLSVLVVELELWDSAIAATKCPNLPFSFADEARDCSTVDSADTAPRSARVLLMCPFLIHWLLFTIDVLALIALCTLCWCWLFDDRVCTWPPVLRAAVAAIPVCGCGWWSNSCRDDCWAMVCCSSCNCDKNDFLQRGVACLTYMCMHTREW